jgi:hypothetical protein
MTRYLIIAIIWLLLIVAVSCTTEQKVPENLTDLVSITLVDDALVFDTSLAEKKLGRDYHFYTHRRLSKEVVSVTFYNKRAEIVGYASVTIKVPADE